MDFFHKPLFHSALDCLIREKYSMVGCASLSAASVVSLCPKHLSAAGIWSPQLHHILCSRKNCPTICIICVVTWKTPTISSSTCWPTEGGEASESQFYIYQRNRCEYGPTAVYQVCINVKWQSVFKHPDKNGQSKQRRRLKKAFLSGLSAKAVLLVFLYLCRDSVKRTHPESPYKEKDIGTFGDSVNSQASVFQHPLPARSNDHNCAMVVQPIPAETVATISIYIFHPSIYFPDLLTAIFNWKYFFSGSNSAVKYQKYKLCEWCNAVIWQNTAVQHWDEIRCLTSAMFFIHFFVFLSAAQ